MDDNGKHYPLAFQLDAVQRVRGSQQSMTHVARDLGVHHKTLRRWLTQLSGDPVEHVETDADIPLRLRKAYQTLRQERSHLRSQLEILARARGQNGGQADH